ncbi:MAG: thioredoxin [candidate division KSB1 bacterium]|nr:thioredoxin [candidate division KSB1 bacterium]
MLYYDLPLQELDDVLAKNDIVMIDFWAEWCGPCRMFAPIFEKAAKNHPDIGFYKVNTEKNMEMAAAFGIQSIPTLAVFREGILLYKQPGALPEAALEDIIRQVRALDMEKIKAEVAAQAGN